MIAFDHRRLGLLIPYFIILLRFFGPTFVYANGGDGPLYLKTAKDDVVVANVTTHFCGRQSCDDVETLDGAFECFKSLRGVCDDDAIFAFFATAPVERLTPCLADNTFLYDLRALESGLFEAGFGAHDYRAYYHFFDLAFIPLIYKLPAGRCSIDRETFHVLRPIAGKNQEDKYARLTAQIDPCDLEKTGHFYTAVDMFTPYPPINVVDERPFTHLRTAVQTKVDEFLKVDTWNTDCLIQPKLRNATLTASVNVPFGPKFRMGPSNRRATMARLNKNYTLIL